MPQFTSEILSAASTAESIALAIWGFLSSDRAIAFYKQVVTILVVIVAIAILGIWEGLKQIAFPVTTIVFAWAGDRLVQGWASFVAWLRQVRAEVEGFVVIMLEGAIGL
jgi:uncharacterized membrane protein YhhN